MAADYMNLVTPASRSRPITFLLPDKHDVVDFQNHPDTLRSQRDGTGADQQRLHHLLVEDVGHYPFPNVDPRVNLPVRVAVPKLGHDLYRVETGILRKGIWNNLQPGGKLPDLRQSPLQDVVRTRLSRLSQLLVYLNVALR